MDNHKDQNLTFHVLCEVETLPADGRAFQIGRKEMPCNIFVIPTLNGPVTYHNRCPHTGVNLEWQPDRFLDSQGEYIQCSNHGARFRIDDGFCVYGPCIGASLQSVPVRINNGWLEVGLPANQLQEI